MSEAPRSFIRSMLLIACAPPINILISLVRMKALALKVGPAGIGLFGIYNSLQTVATGLAGLGIGSGAINQIDPTFTRSSALVGSMADRQISSTLRTCGPDMPTPFYRRLGMTEIARDTRAAFLPIPPLSLWRTWSGTWLP